MQAAKRATDLKQWLSLVGLHRGALALSADAMSKYMQLQQLIAKYKTPWNRLKRTAQQDGWFAALSKHQRDMQKSVEGVLKDVQTAFKAGALRLLLDDVMREFGDPFIVEDLASLLFQQLDSNTAGMLRAVLDQIRGVATSDAFTKQTRRATNHGEL
eukprot:jgi/Chrzof1/12862/Cz07g10030.t1